MGKRLVSIIAAMALVLQMGILAVPAAAEPSALPETDGMARVLTVLDFLDIIDGAAFDPAANPTRAEFVEAMAGAYGLRGVAQQAAPSGFTDVPPEYDGYVSVAKSMGFVNGYTDTLFGSDDKVTYFQAIKFVVSMIGYWPVIENPGEYPDAYVAAAGASGLLSGIAAQGFDGFVTNRDMAVLLYNALEAKMLEPADYAANGRYTVTDKTILDSVLHVTRATGVVVANALTSIDLPDQAAREDCVDILSDGKRASYLAKNSDIADMLGAEVVYYFTEDMQTGDAVLLGYYPAARSEIVEIDAEQIEEIGADYVKYVKEQATRTTRLTFQKGIRIVYNGRAVRAADYTMDLLDIERGVLRFVSSSGGKADTVLVSSYQNARVTGVNADDQLIYVSDNRHGLSVLDLHDVKSGVILKNGADVLPEELKKGEVASVAYSLDKEVVRVLVSDAQVSGEVTEVTETDEKTVLTIDGAAYTLCYDTPDRIRLGDKGVFALDAFGQVFCTGDTITSSGLSYAYVMDTAEKGSVDIAYMIRLLDQSGEILVLPLADKVRMNEATLAKEAAAAAVRKDTLVQYQKNSDGEIRRLDTAVDYTNTTDYRGYDKEVFSKDNPAASMYFKNTAIPSFGGLYLAPEGVPVFNIPEEKEEEEYYMVTGTSVFTPDVFYNVELYDSDEKRQVKAVVNRGVDLNSSSEATLPWNSPALVVQKTSTIYHEERGALDVVTGYQNGELVTIIPANTNNTRYPELGDVVMEEPDKKNSTLFSDLKVGDVIQYKLDVKGEVDAFRVLYRVGDDLGIRIWNGANYAVNLLTAVSMASYADEDTLCITIDDNMQNTPVSNRVFALTDAVNVYEFDKRKKQVRTDRIESIVSMDSTFSGADKIFIRAYRDTVTDIVILREAD